MKAKKKKKKTLKIKTEIGINAFCEDTIFLGEMCVELINTTFYSLLTIDCMFLAYRHKIEAFKDKNIFYINTERML